MRLGALILVVLSVIPSLAVAQQPVETLPGFRAENVLEAREIDNVSPFSGDPGVVIPIGPEYTLSTAFKWQLKAHYSVKLWNLTGLEPPLCTDQGIRYAFVLGDPTIGVGWSLQPGYVVYSQYDPMGPWIYFSADGGRHGAALDSTGVGVTNDGSHLRITAVGGSGHQTPSYYTVEFPDGTKHFFEQTFLPPRPESGVSKDFTNLTAYELLFQALASRYGLTRVQDRFGKPVLKVNYAGVHPWQPTSIVLDPDVNGIGPTVSLHWVQTASLEPATPISWWVIDYALFPAVGSSQRKVNFGYQMVSFNRNPYDLSDSPLNTACYKSPATVAYAPLLHGVTYSDSSGSFTPFGYGFDYSSDDGTLQKITLPTAGTIQYTYGYTTGALCQLPFCDPESPVSVVTPPTPDFPLNIQPFVRFLDHSSSVVSRTETDPTTGRSGVTSYSRQLIVKCTDVNCTNADDSRLFRKVAVTAPGNDDPSGPAQFATRSYFTSPQDGLFSGMEVDRRSYAAGSDTGTRVRTLIRCYGSGGPKCGYRDGTGNLQQYSGAVEPPQAEVTWYGAVPAGSAGGTCAGTNPACAANVSSEYVAEVGKYKATRTSSTLPGMAGWSDRTRRTEWAQPSCAWILDLFPTISTTDTGSGSPPLPAPSSVSTGYSFNSCNGFLSSTTTSDSYGSLTEAFSPDALWNPLSATRSGTGGVSGISFTDDRSFQGGLLLSSQRRGIAWKSFDVGRDSNTGLITFSRDANPTLMTSYAYDALGRLKSITPPGGDAPTGICYDSATQTTVYRASSLSTCPVAAGTTGLLIWQQYRYDGLGRLSREIHRRPPALDGSIRFAVRAHGYDTAGHANFVSEWATCYSVTGDCATATPAGTTSSNFDPFGRPGTITRADGSQTTIDRSDGTILFSDSLERVTISVSGSLATTETRRDALGRIISVKEPAASGIVDETTYRYNVLDKLATVSQSSQTRDFTYDAMGFLRSENTPEKGLVNYSLYDALGNLVSESFPSAGLTRNRTYDPAGRLTLLTSNEGGFRQYVQNQYDQNPQFNFSLGRLTARFSGASGAPDVSDAFTYSNAAGRLSGQTTSVAGGTNPSVTQSWQYNSMGLIAHHHHYRQDNAQAFVVSTDYDAGLPVTHYVNGIPIVKNIAYRASGAVASYKAGIGTGHDVTTTIGQDPSGMARPREIYATEEASGTRRFDTCGYSYDAAGNIVSMGPYCYDESGNIVATGPQDSFQYDGRSRVTFAALSGLGYQYYCYDRYGNRVDKRSDASCPSTVWSDNRVPGIGNYDNRGNQTSNGSYTYDGLDRMIQQTAGGFTYLYDAANERVAKVSSGTWTYTFRDESNRVSTEFTNANSTTTPSRDNIFLGNLLVASYANGQLEGNGPVWTFYSSDHLGTPRLLTRIDGSIYETRKYWPFGDDVSGSTVQRVRFASMERDTESTRYYDHARNHDFSLGRFLSPDVLGGKPADPQSWNRYAYSLNNPLLRVDPDGLKDTVFQRAAAAVISIGAATKDFGASLNQGGAVGVAADAMLGTVGDAVSGTGDLLNVGTATGEAIGSGATSFELTKAISTDVGRASGIVLALAGAGKGLGSDTPTLYRVWGDEGPGFAPGQPGAGPYGKSWAAVDPKAVTDYRDNAGLPAQNTGRFISEGRLVNRRGVVIKTAEPLGGNRGGIREVVVPDPRRQIKLKRVEGLNPPL